MSYEIKDHILVSPNVRVIGISNDVKTGGKPMDIRRCAIVHFTAGGTGISSLNYWREPKPKKDDIGAHIIIERNGEIIQVRAFNRTISHAGASRWRDPKRGIFYKNCNGFSIGIELANAGDAADDIQGEHLIAGYAGQAMARHQNGGPSVNWEKYPEAQINSLIGVLQALFKRYNLDDVTGHDFIAPERKSDPGPLFPWRTVRESVGLSGMPEVHYPPKK